MARTSKEAFELKSLRDRIDRHYKNLNEGNVELRIPKTLTKEIIQSIKPSSIKDETLWQGCVFYIVSSILSRTERKKFKRGNRTRGYVSLKHKYLRDVIGQHTKLTIKTLIENGIIETDGAFAIGGESIGFRLTKSYRKSAFKFVAISDSGIVRRYRAVEQKLFEEQRSRLREHAYLIKWFLDDTLKIDEAAAIKYLHLYTKRMKRNFSKYGLSKDEMDEVNTHLDNTVNSCLNILKNWGKSRPIIDSKGGRLYSNLTGILSQLRYFTNHEGQEIVYFDIRNSQPYHFLALLNPKFWEQPRNQSDLALHNINPELETHIKRRNNKYITTIMMLRDYHKSGRTLSNKGLQRLAITSPHFAHLVATGKLYKFISDELTGKFKKPSGFDPFGTKDLAKQELIRMLYFNSKDKHSPSQNYFAEFKKLFPAEAEVIELLKSRRYQDFSVLLQKIESTILLGHVCKNIFMTDIDIPMYTIHDGIMTTKEHADEVEKIIKQTYMEIIGVEPELKREVMSPKTAGKVFDDYITKKTMEIFRDLGKDFKEDKVKLTLEDIQDLTMSDLFKQKVQLEI